MKFLLSCEIFQCSLFPCHPFYHPAPGNPFSLVIRQFASSVYILSFYSPCQDSQYPFHHHLAVGSQQPVVKIQHLIQFFVPLRIVRFYISVSPTVAHRVDALLPQRGESQRFVRLTVVAVRVLVNVTIAA
jgi:hypothetical protein